jgi:DNA-binding NarL/FixJ family response regulator
MVDRKLAARQYEDLRLSLKESTLIAERKNMCADFDETFLKLFPDFVEKFNLMFEAKDRRQPENDKSLTSEMRIFALMRLGVTDTERIANFLDYSVHTVYTYKTRVKNRSIVKNELFEQRIMEI